MPKTQRMFNKIDIKKAMEIAKKKGLTPVRVKGTDMVQFAKKITNRFEKISWEEFDKTLKERKIAVYEYDGWMKIMKNK